MARPKVLIIPSRPSLYVLRLAWALMTSAVWQYDAPYGQVAASAYAQVPHFSNQHWWRSENWRYWLRSPPHTTDLGTINSSHAVRDWFLARRPVLWNKLVYWLVDLIIMYSIRDLSNIPTGGQSISTRLSEVLFIYPLSNLITLRLSQSWLNSFRCFHRPGSLVPSCFYNTSLCLNVYERCSYSFG
jgi:hypothetical protein